MAEMSRERSQRNGLILLVLIVGQEVQAVVNTTSSRGFNGDAGHSADSDKAAPPNFSEPQLLVAQLAMKGGASPRSLRLAAGWSWAEFTTLTIDTTKDGEIMSETSESRVLVVANLPYVNLAIAEGAGYEKDAEWIGSQVKLVQDLPAVDRTKCSTSTYDVAMGVAQSGGTAGAQNEIMSYLGMARRRHGPLSLEIDAGEEDRLFAEGVYMNFMHGGTYQLCFTPNGPFGGDDISAEWESILTVKIKVLGITSPCEGFYDDGCIRHERWECSFGYKGGLGSHHYEENCQFDFATDSGRPGWGITVEAGHVSKMTWTPAYGNDNLSPDGKLLGTLKESSSPKLCGDQGISLADGEFDIVSGGMYLPITRNTAPTLPAVRTEQKTAFTVAACYCPNYDSKKGSYCDAGAGEFAATCKACDEPEDFIQFFGTVYYWTIRICDGGNLPQEWEECNNPYMRVIPQQQFTLRVDCPPGGGCLPTWDNRIKFLEPSQVNEEPNWHPNNGCKTEPKETPFAVWPYEPDAKSIPGGDRVDYKVWHTKQDNTPAQVKINLSLNKKLDVCFANEKPEDHNSWFRIGQVITSSSFAFASSTSTIQNEASALFHLKFVDEPGTVTLYGGMKTNGDVLNPYDGNRYSGKALINILSYDRLSTYGSKSMGTDKTIETYLSELDQITPDDLFQTAMDAECQKANYNGELIRVMEPYGPAPVQYRARGTWTEMTAARVMAQVDPGANTPRVEQFMPFTGPNGGQEALQVVHAGVISICYCAIVTPDERCDTTLGSWIYVGQTTIRGPTGKPPPPAERWQFDTDIVVNLRMEGWGLSGCDPAATGEDDCNRPNRDRLRIISQGECIDGGNYPDGTDSFRINCPGPNEGSTAAATIVSCESAQGNTDIEMLADTAVSTNRVIIGYIVSSKKTTLTFSDDISDVFEDGDHITLDLDRIMIDNKNLDQMEPHEKYEAFKFTGEYRFMDAQQDFYWVSHKVTLVRGGAKINQVTIPIGWLASDDPGFQFQDNAGWWTKRNKIFSRTEIKGKGKSSRPPGQTTSIAKVCWGVSGAYGQQARYYAEAGEIEFRDPYTRDKKEGNLATVSLTTYENSAIAPVIITFTTSAQPGYKFAPGSKPRTTQLMMRFLDIASDGTGQLVPRYSQDRSPTGASMPLAYLDTEQVSKANAEQWVCGRLFVELWAKDDDDGFPLPASCYYGPQHRDAQLVPAGGASCENDEEYCQAPKFYREFYIVFGELNGLKGAKEYQIVLNAQTTNVLKGGVLLDMYAMCSEETGCERPYEVFEKIPVYAAESSRRSQTDPPDNAAEYLTMTRSTLGEPQWGQGGEAFLIQRGDPQDNVLRLHDLNVLQVKLTGGDGTEAIRRDQIVRIFLWPLTLWEAGEAGCKAFCEPYHASNAKCEGNVPCETQQVVKGGNRNIIKITLPTDMDDISGAIQHTIQINSLEAQTWGFFPTRLGAELRDENDEKPTYTTSAGYVMNDPDKGACSIKKIDGILQWACERNTRTVGMLVLDARTGYGPKPFANQNNNILYVRIQFGATLWHAPPEGTTTNSNGVDADAAEFVVYMPGSPTDPSYTCVAVEQPPVDIAIFQVDRNDGNPGYIDNPRGVLNVGGSDGQTLDSNGRQCVYKLGSRQAIFAKQVAYMKFIVHNPDAAMRKDNPANYWEVELRAKGQHNNIENAVAMEPVRFISLGVEQSLRSKFDVSEPAYWGSNAAVLSRLDDDTSSSLPVLQPADFRASCCAGYDERTTRNQLNIFFRTTEYVGREGYIIVDAPEGFDFAVEPQACDARDLVPDSYYAFIGIDVDAQLHRLRDMGSCVPSKFPFLTATSNNRAILQVRGAIEEKKWYGFSLAVNNPVFYDITQHGTFATDAVETGWFLFTENHLHYGVEGTEHTIRLNRIQGSSEQEHYHRSWGVYKDTCDITPQVTDMRYTGQFVDVIFYPIQVNDKLGVTETSLRVTAPDGYIWDDSGELGNSFMPTSNGTTLPFLDGALPEVKNSNQLIFASLALTGRDQSGPVKYGFRHKVKVPPFSPVTSSNSFFLEWGYKESCVEDGAQSCSSAAYISGGSSAGEGGGRIKACVEPAPMVAALTNAAVAYATNLVGWENNFLEFHVQTVTPLHDNEGIVIKGDTNTAGFQFKKSFTILEGSHPLPPDAFVLPQTSNDNLPMVVIRAVNTPISAGFYKLELPVINPREKTAASSSQGNWVFGTYKNVNPWTEQSQNIDKEITAPGFRVNERMPDARLLNDILDPEVDKLIQTNYRPGEQNQLIFRFELQNEPTDLNYMILRGPRGFEFDEDCLDENGPHRIIVQKALVFGTEAKWDPDITEWGGTGPVSCVGDGRQVTIGIPAGLQKYNSYAFRIGVKSNPIATPSPWNKWSMDFNGESSEPFPGFVIWTNTNMQITPSTNATSPNQQGTSNIRARTQNPVEIMFQPQNAIPPRSGLTAASAGYIRLRAPSTFEVVQPNGNGECQVHLREQGGTVFGEDDLLCEVINSGGGTTSREMTITVNGDKAIEAQRMYILIVYVFNPDKPNPTAENWEMDSFANDDEKLDKSFVKGFPVNMVLNQFDVLNPANEKKGRASVEVVEITMEFPDPMKDDDIIMMHAPLGFNIQSDPDRYECNEFQWRASSLPSRDEPKCECDTKAEGLQCHLWWLIKENNPGGQALRMNTPLKFKIATTNPAKTPFITDNFWRVSHTRDNTVKSSDVYRSWYINPQLEDVDIKLGDGSQAAGATSDLMFSFTPVSDASTIKIEAVFPTDFNFAESSVDAPMDIDARTQQFTIIINQCDIEEGRPKEIWVKSVQLGRGGGETRFNIATYSSALPADETLWDTVKRDEKYGFTEGFRLPGKITLSQQKLTSRFKEEQQLYPVKALFQPRVDEVAKAYFTIMMTQQVRASEKLKIQCRGDGAYELKASPFVLIGTAQVLTTTEVALDGQLEATLMPGSPDAMIAMHPDTPYKVVVEVIPKPGDNTWWFSTWDGNPEYPTNTNDGAGKRFEPVEKMELVVHTTRSPPDARTDVLLTVTEYTKTIRELLIIAPPAFEFPPEGCGDMCKPGQALGSTGRRTATWSSPTGDPLTNLNGLRIRVVTPEQTPDSTEWYVEGREQGGSGSTTGWGQGSGFLVEQMAMTSVSYPGVANLKNAQIIFTFSISVNAGTIISVIPPTGYLLTCSTEGALKQISLPGSIPDCVDDPLELTLTRTLTAGEYAFGVSVDVPPQIDPAQNRFNIKVKNQENQVVDAAFGVKGESIVQNLQVSSPTLSWSKSDPGSRSIITFGLKFNAATSRLKALLLNFPAKFIHDVQRPTDVVNLNKRFKVAPGRAGDWADTQFTDRLRIYLDDSDPTTTIAAGVYKFSFPVRVPCCTQEDMPRINVWYLSLCDDRSCSKPGDRSILVTLPMAGFALNELAPETIDSELNEARQCSPPFGTRLCTIVAWFVPLALLWY